MDKKIAFATVCTW